MTKPPLGVAWMWGAPIELGRGFERASKLVRISDLAVLEGGTYWPELRPHFDRPEFRRLRYSIQERGRDAREPQAVSFRGASSVDLLDIAFIADRSAATLRVAGAGLPDHCLTLVQSGGLSCTRLPNAPDLRIDRRIGLIYRGWPGMAVSASSDHQRIAIWIPDAGVRERLSALLGHPVDDDIVFDPLFAWDAPVIRTLRCLVDMLLDEFGHPRSTLALGNAGRSFADLFIYTLLRSVRHSHTARLERPVGPVLPKTQRRAEEFIEASLEAPITLHEVAAAAGCSVRSLQSGFRHYRGTTLLAFIRAARPDRDGPARHHGHGRGAAIRVHEPGPVRGTIQAGLRDHTGRAAPQVEAVIGGLRALPYLRRIFCAFCPAIARTVQFDPVSTARPSMPGW